MVAPFECSEQAELFKPWKNYLEFTTGNEYYYSDDLNEIEILINYKKYLEVVVSLNMIML